MGFIGNLKTENHYHVFFNLIILEIKLLGFVFFPQNE